MKRLLPVALAILSASAAAAQLSPGKLSRAHVELEGSANCLRCHQARKRVDPALCLTCHEPLAGRIEAGRGLHAKPGYERCETCHIEHHGRDFELVWWGDGGRDAFDHGLTGFELEGAHAERACADCHRRESMVDALELERAGKDLGRTFLGLDRGCLSCHEDGHQGQTAADACAACHDFTAWTPASRFDHDRTSFPLTGLHVSTACSSCHGTVERPQAAGGSPLRFAVESFEECSDCHRDPHEGRLGGRCASCHSTVGWSWISAGRFDHAQTRFALVGAHQQVACTSCHAPGGGFEVERFERCTDCHRDDHLGQFAGHVENEDCTACHTVETFLPATFSIADHQESPYPLVGAHLATACIDCHAEVSLDEVRPLVEPWRTEGAPSAVVRQFRFAGTACRDCHGDPHEGELSEWQGSDGCESCHEESSWRAVSFDHDRTELPLRGRHVDLGCADCHAKDGPPTLGVPMALTSASADCASCHEDPHRSQFADAERATPCAACHVEEAWTELRFDHDRDTRFALEGAHRKLACASCHPVETGDGSAFIRYRPVASTCEACHATVP